MIRPIFRSVIVREFCHSISQACCSGDVPWYALMSHVNVLVREQSQMSALWKCCGGAVLGVSSVQRHHVGWDVFRGGPQQHTINTPHARHTFHTTLFV